MPKNNKDFNREWLLVLGRGLGKRA